MIIFVSDMFVENYVGGGELTSEAIIKGSLVPIAKINSVRVNIELMKTHKDKFWVFGNFADLSDACIVYAIKNLTYTILEYDYKYCIYRSPEKHIAAKGHCNCEKERRGKLVSVFFRKAKKVWFMSEKQRDRYLDKFPFLNNTKVLSSVFSDDTLEYIRGLDTSEKNNKWIVLNSESWVKGRDAAVKIAQEQELEYELVWGIEHKELLKKMANSKGLIYTPVGADTCPRLTIEAKLLNCEMILNENVQHKDEEWFTNKDMLWPYLNERASVFWSAVEEFWNIDTPKAFPGEENTFNFIVPFYNAGPWIKKCIDSIKRQTYSNYRCFLIDDLSTDNSCNIIQREIKDDKRFKLISNKTKRYALGNITQTIEDHSTDKEDINIILDGDDWLSSIYVLSHLNKVYRDEECLMTYGNYVYYPNGQKGVEPSAYPDDIINNNSFRQDKWRASHLRTFKTELWKHIKLDDLKDDDGDYYKTAYDQALMLPLLETSGHKSRFIGETMHVYNRSNPLNVDKVKQQLQYQTAQKIRAKKPYERKY